MSTKEERRYLELQMEELKAEHATSDEEKKTATEQENKNFNSKNAEIAKLYEDAAEYEEDLKGFEEELEVVNANELQNVSAALIKQFPDEDRDYAQELQSVLEVAWRDLVEVQKSHPLEQLNVIVENSFTQSVEKLPTLFPEYAGDFETEIRAILVKRWEMLIAIKKEHIKEELAEIKILGLKPKYAQRIYKQFHGIA